MSFELPEFNQLSVEKICKVRRDEGAAFASFRDALASKLREIPIELDDAEKLRKLQNIQHELMEVQVNSVKRSMDSLSRGLKFDAAAVGIGLLTAVLQPAIALGGVLVAARQGLELGRKVTDYFNSVKTHPGYFAWKLRESSRPG